MDYISDLNMSWFKRIIRFLFYGSMLFTSLYLELVIIYFFIYNIFVENREPMTLVGFPIMMGLMFFPIGVAILNKDKLYQMQIRITDHMLYIEELKNPFQYTWNKVRVKNIKHYYNKKDLELVFVEIYGSSKNLLIHSKTVENYKELKKIERMLKKLEIKRI